MKTKPLFLTALLCAAPLCAQEKQTIDLGDGMVAEVGKGSVSVKSSSQSNGGSTSSSVRSSSQTDASGRTVTTIVTEKDGVKSTRTIVVDKDGKVTVDGKPSSAGSPPAAPGAGDPDNAAPPSGGWLGVHSIPVSDAVRAQVEIPEGQGVVIEFIAPGGPAFNAGLQENDIVLLLNDAAVKGVEDFRAKLRALDPGAKVKLDYLRKGRKGTATATLSTRPADSEGPDSTVSGEANRLQQGMHAAGGSGKRAVVVEGDGKTRIVEGDATDPFELLLDDPNVPESMKAQIREARERLRETEADAKEAREAAEREMEDLRNRHQPPAKP